MDQQQQQQRQQTKCCSTSSKRVHTAEESVLKHLTSSCEDHALRCPCYCEENVWRIAYKQQYRQQNSSSSSGKYFAVFISNPQQCLPMFHQKAATARCCYWDYHVILVEQRQATTTLVYDVDTTLTPYPMELSDYLDVSFPTIVAQTPQQSRSSSCFMSTLQHHYIPYFRIIPITDYIQYFSSDRRHMFNKETNEWNAPPPYQSIARVSTQCSESHDNGSDLQVHSLSNYLDFTAAAIEDSSSKLNRDGSIYGRIVAFHEFRNF